MFIAFLFNIDKFNVVKQQTYGKCRNKTFKCVGRVHINTMLTLKTCNTIGIDLDYFIF